MLQMRLRIWVLMKGLNKILFLIPVILVAGFLGFSRGKHLSSAGRVRVMFYNVENLFDTKDDPRKNDNEFLPGSKKNWSDYRYRQKLTNIYQVMTAVGEGSIPDMAGLCEVENKSVLFDLIRETPLLKYNFRFIHKDSPDQRGIDVCLLYNPATISIIDTAFIRVTKADEHPLKTRDILYAKVKLLTEDTLHVFVNHWPSRYGGEKKSVVKRVAAARILRNYTDSLFKLNKNANILIMGDFNDEPGDLSLAEVLNAKCPVERTVNHLLYNLTCHVMDDKNEGTHKFRSEWSVFDQIIVSGGLLQESGSVVCDNDGARVFNDKFLLENDERYMGKKPFRTYYGPQYHGGYSDHLPVYVDLFLF